jgi:hypothetical protein
MLGASSSARLVTGKPGMLDGNLLNAKEPGKARARHSAMQDTPMRRSVVMEREAIPV